MGAVDFARFVDEMAQASGEAILPFFRTHLGTEDKNRGGAFDPVTEADKAAEIIMRRMIEDTFPAHGIIGEEFGNKNESADYVWVLDPIDGTKSFISGLPLWGSLIGLQHKGSPCYGMMHQPFTRERFSGDGQGALWRGLDRHGKVTERALRTRACDKLSQATLMTTHPSLLGGDTRAPYDRVEKQVRLSRYGGDCYAYCMVAAGQIDLVIESGLKPYDIVALIPIIKGAGGIITNWQGESAASGGTIIAAGDKRVHEEALRILNA